MPTSLEAKKWVMPILRGNLPNNHRGLMAQCKLDRPYHDRTQMKSLKLPALGHYQQRLPKPRLSENEIQDNGRRPDTSTQQLTVPGYLTPKHYR
ncbi:MAG: hypothetical protein JWQ57_1398 [Mucilaginibacter sp.]|nr:hypothetical protein [Mucilaginibacter sp.]